ncbi:RPA family protein [Halobaculum litoreum]|uniref:RPA family protein n=1 Tax=Halobaculum litoreum TaxID=3031998 RepID=A0ABD5XTH8_9EURY|nr:hypothetical protein [Halobaculum sp. DT92]
MSSSDGGDDSGPGTREVAHRIFAAEFDDADFEYSESDEERAPNYVVTPTGLRANRLFTVGVLTEVESVNEQTLRGRVVDPTGAFVTYAGQYQPDEMAFLDRTTPPAFVSLAGKARTFQPEDSDLVYTSVRPESFAVVDAETRDRWTVSAAEATLRRVALFAAALEVDARGDDLRAVLEDAGVPAAMASGIPLAVDHYGTGTRYLEAVRRLAVDALEVVADERDEVRDLDAAPGDRGGAELGPLPDVPYDLDAAAPEAGAAADAADDPTEGSEATEEPAAAADAAPSDGSTPDESAGGDAGTAAEPASSADTEAAGDGTDDADDLPEFDDADASDEPAAAAGDAAASTASVTDAAADDTATEPAETAGAEPDGADVAEADPGAGVEPEPVESADATADATDADDLGDFDDGGLGDFDDADEEPAVDLDADPEDLDDALTEEERREVEEEHGVEFATGSEVPDPGEAGIETPDPDDLAPEEDRDAEPSAAAAADTESATEPAGATDATAAEGTDPAGEDAEDAAEPPEDLESAVVDLMSELDDGDGADEDAVIEAAVDRYGVDAATVEDAIEGALMGGQCFEPTDGTLKAI